MQEQNERLNLDALFKIPYGLYVAGVEKDGRYNGCIINTASQVTAEPPRLVVTMQKSTYTSELIRQKGSMAISILSRDCPMEVITRFGYQSGRDADKWTGAGYRIDLNGNPCLSRNTTALLSLKVEQTVDVDTHWLFLCPVQEARITTDARSMTYDDYRVLKAGGSLGQDGARPPERKFTCTVCHYTYDGEVPFDELPEDYVCPICGVRKKFFVLA